MRGVYMLYRPDSGLAYVGQAIDVEKRLRHHRRRPSRAVLKLSNGGGAPEVFQREVPFPGCLNTAEKILGWEAREGGWTLVNRQGFASVGHDALVRREARDIQRRRWIAACDDNDEAKVLEYSLRRPPSREIIAEAWQNLATDLLGCAR